MNSYSRHSYSPLGFLTLAVVAALAALPAAAQQAAPQPAAPQAAAPQTTAPQNGAAAYTPSVGQAGKDVVWVPTQSALIEQMLNMAQVTPADRLVDLGSGDGRTVIAAAKRGLQAHGIEYNPQLVELSRRNAAEEGVSERATFAQGDIFRSDFSQASVVTLFLLQSLNERLRPTLLAMAPGTRVVSNTFTMGDWEPDEQFTGAPGCTSFCRAYKWIIPARVEGRWQTGGGELALTQRYQMLTGTLTMDGRAVAITEGRMDGRRISFKAGDQSFSGEAQDNRLSGTVGGGGSWSAERAG